MSIGLTYFDSEKFMLTAKQHETYTFIKSYILTNGIAPTEAEIAAGIGIKSRGVVHRYVKALNEAGLLKVIPHKRRNIELVQKDSKSELVPGLPVVGKIAAGQPIEAINRLQELNVQEMVVKNNRYILEVSGDSMMGDNICDGDYIICESCQTAGKDDIVVALIDNTEATLKRVEDKGDSVVLIPSNPEHQKMEFSSDRVQIQGKYIGLLRLTH